MPLEGLLKPIINGGVEPMVVPSEARLLSREGPVALPVEGLLKPIINGGVEPMVVPSEARL
jgi:hypothetical protein